MGAGVRAQVSYSLGVEVCFVPSPEKFKNDVYWVIKLLGPVAQQSMKSFLDYRYFLWSLRISTFAWS